MRPFTKPAITPSEQIQLLENRGLTIQNKARAECFLEAVSFFRLTPYMRPFQLTQDDHQFKPDASFKQLSELYDFDRRLRLLVIDAIERIEVAIRTHISNFMGPTYGAHWYLSPHLFKNHYCESNNGEPSSYDRFIKNIESKQNKARNEFEKECARIQKAKHDDPSMTGAIIEKRRKETYARHYATTYNEPALMPGWAMVEELSLGELSRLFKNIAKLAVKKKIAQTFTITDFKVLESWLHTLTAIRNICAHHSRLWNRALGVQPKTYPITGVDEAEYQRVGKVLVILQFFMQQAAPHASWHKRLIALFKEFPEINQAAMGLPQGWQQDPFWQEEQV